MKKSALILSAAALGLIVSAAMSGCKSNTQPKVVKRDVPTVPPAPRPVIPTVVAPEYADSLANNQ